MRDDVFVYSVFMAFTLAIALYLLLFAVFITAYSLPQKAILVTINEYGEADIELVILSIVTIFIMFVYFWFIKRVISTAKSIS